jgi:hypothetical protein
MNCPHCGIQFEAARQIAGPHTGEGCFVLCARCLMPSVSFAGLLLKLRDEQVPFWILGQFLRERDRIRRLRVHSLN